MEGRNRGGVHRLVTAKLTPPTAPVIIRFVSLPLPLTDPEGRVLGCWNKSSACLELVIGGEARISWPWARRGVWTGSPVVDATGEKRLSDPSAAASQAYSMPTKHTVSVTSCG